MVSKNNGTNLIDLCKLLDIPEFINVSTKFITKRWAQAHQYEHMYNVQDLCGDIQLERSDKSLPLTQPVIIVKNTDPIKITVATTSMVMKTSNSKPEVCSEPLKCLTEPTALLTETIGSQETMNRNASTMTKLILYNDKSQQTDQHELINHSIGIQCNLDSTSEDKDVISENDENNLSVISISDNIDDEAVEHFKYFLNDNSKEYKNGMRECYICGEIMKVFHEFLRHMSVHYGPAVLCSKCGQCFQHESFLKTHICENTFSLNKRKILQLRCPHYCCGVVGISKLELYDHISEHIKHRGYYCSVCSKKYCTAEEYLHHLLLRANCYVNAKRPQHMICGLNVAMNCRYRVRVQTVNFKGKRILVKTALIAKQNNWQFCQICLKKFCDRIFFKRHLIGCLRWYKKNLKRKRFAIGR